VKGNSVTQNTDLFYDFTSLPSAQVVAAVKTVIQKRGDVESALAEWLTHRPLESLTGNALDPPGRVEPASARGQELILERLDAILAELRQRPQVG
jgi:hypothetical protein